MVNTLNIPGLGRLEIIETYAYYDEPVLFSCKNVLNQFYFVVAADENDRYETWLYVRVSNERLNLIRKGKIDLHDAFACSEDGTVLQVRFPYDKQLVPKIDPVETKQISMELLPIPGECLDYEDDIILFITKCLE